MATAEAATKRKAVVLYDGLCPLCRKSAGWLRRLDWFGKLECRDARDAAHLPDSAVPLDPKRLLEEMHLVTPDRRRAYHGFRAFRWMAWYLPAVWPILPLLYVPGVPRVGQWLYLQVAKRRFDLVPCRDGACHVPLHRGKGT
jgi:predicted DCC family thiol-disulfide oxidoreductase YuxK